MKKNATRHQFTTKPSSTRLQAELMEAGAGTKALENDFIATPGVYGRDELDARRAGQIRERTARTWRKVAALGAIAAFGIFGAPKVAQEIAPSATGHTFTQDELAGMPQKTYTFKPDQGIDDAIVKVDGSKGIFSDGPDLAAVENYVAAQAPGGVPQPNETVQVPVIPETGK